MIEVSLDALLRQMEELEQEVTRKLTFMVVEFGKLGAEKAAMNTPLGSLPDAFYEYRQSVHNTYPLTPGMAQGGWNAAVGTTVPSLGAYYDVGIEASVNTTEASLYQDYDLGESFYIYNDVPYMTKRNGIFWNGKSMRPVDPSGLFTIKPTVEALSSLLATDFVEMYNRG